MNAVFHVHGKPSYTLSDKGYAKTSETTVALDQTELRIMVTSNACT